MDLFDHTTVRTLARRLSAAGGEAKSFDTAQSDRETTGGLAKQRTLRVGKPA